MIRRIYRNLYSYLSRIRRSYLILITILIVFWSSFVLFEFILKGSYIFEGQVTVNEMSFTYNGNLDRPLLQNVIGIQKLDITGQQSQTLTLKGKFTSNDKNLNQKLRNLDKLKIEFPYATSRLILTSTDLSLLRKFALLELRINPNTKINQLIHNKDNQLDFCLQSVTQDSKYCLYPENADNDPSFSSAESLGNLKLRLGIQPYIINLEKVNIPVLNITTEQNRNQSIKLNYIPQTKEPQLNIFSPTKIVIDLPELTTIKPNTEIEIPQWFYEDLDVRDVKFAHVKQLSNVADAIPNSTIINGKVRMKGQELELEKNQFLIINDDKPGIRKLRYLSINPLKPQGLQTFISGESKGIAIGLYPEFPIETIQPSWLSKYVSPDAIAGILSFISAFTAVILEKILFPDNP